MLLQQHPLSPLSIPIHSSRTRLLCHCSSSEQLQGGQLRRVVLSNSQRKKLNASPDTDFYSFPRLVTHVDDGFIQSLTQLYRERIPPDSELLDLMSSWVSHLPADVSYRRVVGHGLNALELSKNKRLDSFFVKDINVDQRFEMKDCSFDAVVCAVSVQYMVQPEKVFGEIYRLLKPGGVCIVSFSNRMFYDKAVAAWRDASDYGRVQLVVQYFQSVVGFTQPEVVKKMPSWGEGDTQRFVITKVFDMFRAAGRDPFYAVVAYRNFKPVKEKLSD